MQVNGAVEGSVPFLKAKPVVQNMARRAAFGDMYTAVVGELDMAVWNIRLIE
jgi:hypothetical protein